MSLELKEFPKHINHRGGGKVALRILHRRGAQTLQQLFVTTPESGVCLSRSGRALMDRRVTANEEFAGVGGCIGAIRSENPLEFLTTKGNQ